MFFDVAKTIGFLERHYIATKIETKEYVNWDSIRKCPDDDMAVGIQLVVDECDKCDRTGINQVRLFCKQGAIVQSPDISPDYAIRGSPKTVYLCKNNTHIVGLKMKTSQSS